MPDQRPRREKSASRETSLYLPVKRFLEALGFEVKGEICGCDLVAIRGEEPPLVVIGELKLGFNLDLVLQGIDRTAACDQVWLAVRSSRRGRERDSRVRKLCRLLGFGLLGVSASGRVEVLVEPGRGVRAATGGAARACSTNIGGGSAIPPPAAAARRRL